SVPARGIRRSRRHCRRLHDANRPRGAHVRLRSEGTVHVHSLFPFFPGCATTLSQRARRELTGALVRTPHQRYTTTGQGARKGVQTMSAQPQWHDPAPAPRPVEGPASRAVAERDRNAARIVTVVALTSIAAGAIHIAAAATIARGNAQTETFFGVAAA